MAMAARRLTLEEFLKLPEEKPALEYVDGEVRQKVSPKLKHGVLQYGLAERINAFAVPKRMAIAIPEARTTFAGKSHVPDVSVYRWQRIPIDEAGEVADDSHEPPDLAIEILSPGQGAQSMAKTCRWYAANGVEIALLVDSHRRSVRAFRSDGARSEWRGADAIDLDPVVPGFRLTVDELFASLRIQGR